MKKYLLLSLFLIACLFSYSQLIVSAGGNQTITLPTNSVVLNGSVSGGTAPYSISWVKVYGNKQGRLISPHSLSCSFTNLVASTYKVQLIVKDSRGYTKKASAIITVNGTPPPPPTPVTVNAGADQNITGSTTTLSGSASGGTITSYSWAKLTGNANAQIGTPLTATTNVAGLTVGTYIFRLTSVNSVGSIGYDDLTVTVTSVPPFSGTRWYVDPTSTASTANGTFNFPFKTATQVNNAQSSFNPDDSILFKRGTVLIGKLNITKSGTAGHPINYASYGTGLAPRFQYNVNDGVNPEDREMVTISSKSYITFTGLKFTDTTQNSTDRSLSAHVGYGFGLYNCSNISINNCYMSLLGVCIAANTGSSFNTFNLDTFTNLRMVRNTPGGDDDYGANGFVLSGSDNTITSCRFIGCWADSYDYTYDGGAVEVFGGQDRNKVFYCTMEECNGIMEIGSGSGGTASDNELAYNLMINNGLLTYMSTSGTFAVTVQNLQYYNNNIVETNNLFNQGELFGRASGSSVGMLVLKNNVFNLTTGIDVAHSGEFAGTECVHTNNTYKLSGGSVVNYTLTGSEQNTSATIWTNTSAPDPINWNYAPSGGSVLIDFGTPISGLTRDFNGNPIGTPPNCGMLE